MKKKAKTNLFHFIKHSRFVTCQWLRLIILVGLGLFWQTTTNAQSPAPPNDSYVTFSSGQGTVFVSLPDTSDCSELEVTLGSRTETGDLFAHVYNYDQVTGLPSGLSYTRSGSNIWLGIGMIEVPPAYNVKLRLKDTSGNWSLWYEYITN